MTDGSDSGAPAFDFGDGSDGVFEFGSDSDEQTGRFSVSD